MSRTFIYARVSTADQNTDNQILEIEAAGLAVDKRRIVSESISGSVAATERPQFARLLDRLEPGDVHIVVTRGLKKNIARPRGFWAFQAMLQLR